VKEVIRPIVVTHGRAGRVTAHKHIANLWLCCPEGQVDAYVDAHPEFEDRVDPYPDELAGNLLKVRKWTYKFDSAFEVDDDLIGMYRVYRRPAAWKKATLSPERAYEQIQATAVLADQLGAQLFGYAAHANPVTFNGLRPFKFGGYGPGGATGALPGYKGFLPDDERVAVGLDHWHKLINACFHRYCLYDLRFACAFKDTYVGVGGTAAERGKKAFEGGKDLEEQATDFLIEMFGNDVVQRSDTTYNPSGVTKKMKNSGRRRIVLPYKV
jgi:hypothetical protein